MTIGIGGLRRMIGGEERARVAGQELGGVR